jgi:hypothetical protein
MDGEKQPQSGSQTTHGFLIFLTFLFSPLSAAALQNRARSFWWSPQQLMRPVARRRVAVSFAKPRL